MTQKSAHTLIESTALATAPPEGIFGYDQDTDTAWVSDGTNMNPLGGGAGLVDGDYGDITVGGSGTTMTIDNDSVTYAKIQNVTDNRVLGRIAGSSGDVQEIQLVDTATIAWTLTV